MSWGRGRVCSRVRDGGLGRCEWGGMAFVGGLDMVIPKILDWVLFASAELLECVGDGRIKLGLCMMSIRRCLS